MLPQKQTEIRIETALTLWTGKGVGGKGYMARLGTTEEAVGARQEQSNHDQSTIGTKSPWFLTNTAKEPQSTGEVSPENVCINPTEAQ